ncbi:hypothetical protein WJX84_011251 [Apatococcus fuscideae]|uniref:Uncharacterized protein n=1 Tax=Apatococcus fuscideae TaxID=2026836 RepID=A0AAW1TFG3_9CHLO
MPVGTSRIPTWLQSPLQIEIIVRGRAVASSWWLSLHETLSHRAYPHTTEEGGFWLDAASSLDGPSSTGLGLPHWVTACSPRLAPHSACISCFTRP